MVNRRKLLQLAAISASAAMMPRVLQAREGKLPDGKLMSGNVLTGKKVDFIFSLNMATIRGHKLGFVKELEIAAKAGFKSVEIWMDSLQQYLENGGTAREAFMKIQDLGLKIENCIGFAEWIVDDDARRNRAMEQLKREMEILASIDCPRIAAPPMGATDTALLDLHVVAERYRNILELGHQKGVIPQLEMWGFSNNLKRISDVTFVAMESRDLSAKLLLDVYHIFKGQSAVDNLSYLSDASLEVFHINDYPANLSSEKITDADRIYAGDGIAPLKKILSLVRRNDKPVVLSFEVFNPAYYRTDPLLVAQTSLKKMKKIVSTLDAG